ncbi:MAG: transketolase family protein [Thermodesulfobacteriota bacterium]
MKTQYLREVKGDHESMYSAHNRALIQLARKDSRIITCYGDFVTGEAGEVFHEEFPDRILDVGIAEGHLITSAAGLSNAGFIPFTHCHCLFGLGLGYNQIRHHVAYDKRNVKIVLCNSGMIWGDIGPSHLAVEDLAALRAIPNLTILSPSDAVSTEKATIAAAEYIGPVIIRLPFINANYPTLYRDDFTYEIGKAFHLHPGDDVAIIATGILVSDALDVAEKLERDGIHARLLDMQTVKPLDEAAIVAAARETGAVVTVEDGSIVGGLGGAIAELISETYPVPLRRIGVQDQFGESGKGEEIKEHYGLSAECIAHAVHEVLRAKKG